MCVGKERKRGSVTTTVCNTVRSSGQSATKAPRRSHLSLPRLFSLVLSSQGSHSPLHACPPTRYDRIPLLPCPSLLTLTANRLANPLSVFLTTIYRIFLHSNASGTTPPTVTMLLPLLLLLLLTADAPQVFSRARAQAQSCMGIHPIRGGGVSRCTCRWKERSGRQDTRHKLWWGERGSAVVGRPSPLVPLGPLWGHPSYPSPYTLSFSFSTHSILSPRCVSLFDYAQSRNPL